MARLDQADGKASVTPITTVWADKHPRTHNTSNLEEDGLQLQKTTSDSTSNVFLAHFGPLVITRMPQPIWVSLLSMRIPSWPRWTHLPVATSSMTMHCVTKQIICKCNVNEICSMNMHLEKSTRIAWYNHVHMDLNLKRKFPRCIHSNREIYIHMLCIKTPFSTWTSRCFAWGRCCFTMLLFHQLGLRWRHTASRLRRRGIVGGVVGDC